MAEHNELGKSGEDAAIEYLEQKGYRILQRNWRKGHYELDIVASDGEELVIVEVKTRTVNYYGDPLESLSKQQMNRIIHAADYFVKRFDIDLPVRFDIISMLGNAPYFDIDHIEDAFYPQLFTYK